MLAPAALLAPVVAAIGERYPPGKALVVGYVAQALSCGVVAAALLSSAPSLVVYAALVGPAVAFTMTRPTQAAFAPGLARRPRELAATNVVSGWVESMSVLVAPVFAGVLLTVGSPWLVFALMGAGCLVGALLVAPLRAEVPAAAQRYPAHAPLRCSTPRASST